MCSATSFAAIRNDSGLVSEILPVSHVYVRVGPPHRGRHQDGREARTWRSDARWARRQRGLSHERQLELNRFLRLIAA